MKSTHNSLNVRAFALAASAVLLATGSLQAADAVFSSVAIGAGNNDANVGLLGTKTYFNAVNLNGGGLTINGVAFAASSGANPSGSGYTISGVPNTHSGGTNNVTGQLGSLVNDFIYGGNPAVLTLSGLTPGQTYTLTSYNRVWDASARTQNITATSGATAVFNQDFNTVGDLNLLRYTFTASGTSETVNFAPQVSGSTFHFYGFSTEQTFNNTWTSGANWTTASWSGGVPNSVGANADFTSQGTATAVSLDASQTVGHVRFDGANAWTVSGANTLTLQADVGGVSVLAATSGTHSITSSVTLGSDVLKTGAGTLVLSGAITDNGRNVTLGAGTLEIANASAQTMSGNFAGGGNLAKGGAGTLTLTGAVAHTGSTTVNAGTLEFAPAGAVTYANGIGGAGAFAKGGSATLTLTGTNTYTGATLVNGGTLRLQAGSAPLLTDNFAATGNPNTMDLNFNLANRQSGSAATQSWTPTGNTQVGNPTNVVQPSGTNGDYLLLAFGAKAKLAGFSLSNVNVPGPVKINFDMFKGSASNTTDWTSFTLRTSGDGFPIAGSGELGFLYRKNTGIQIFNNGGLLEDFGSTSGGDSFGFYLADSAGTGSPFAGNGTRVIVTQGGSVLGSYALNTGMAASLIAFGSNGTMIGGVDNLAVNNFRTNVLDPATAVSLTTSGASLELEGVIQTVASLSGVSGSAVNLGPFSRLTVNGSASTSFDGVISGAFGALTKAGSGTQVLTGANTYGGGTTIAAGTLGFASGSLGSTGPITFSGSSTLRWEAGNTQDISARLAAIGSGVTATFDTNGNNVVLASVLSGAGSLAKTGSGTLTLNGANTYAGNTSVAGGTLLAGTATAFGSGNVTVGSGATLNLNGQAIANAITNNGGTIVGASGSATLAQNGGTLSGNLGGTITATGTVAGAPTFTGTVKGSGTTFTGAVTFANGSTHSPGNSPGVQTFASGVTYDNGSTLDIELEGNLLDAPGSNYDIVLVTGGDLTVNAVSVLRVIDFGSAITYASTEWDSVRNFTIVDSSGGGTTSGAFTLDTSLAGSFGSEGSWSLVTLSGPNGDVILTWTPVPEPSTYAALAGLAALGLAWRRRRAQ